jgi:hypothetical protein
MKCPVCYASQKIYDNEVAHVCPYCDAILIYDGRSLRRIDRFPWWIKRRRKVEGFTGLVITEKNELYFKYTGRWILNEDYYLFSKNNERGRMDENVIEIYGSFPILAFPGIGIGVEKGKDIKITHPGGSTIFKRIEE